MYVYTYVYHIFIHSSVDGHLGGFHSLTFVNNAAMNTGVAYIFSNWYFSDIYLQVELGGHTLVLFLAFCGTSILFSTAAATQVPCKQ